MKKIIFVTGTDTGVGKTLLSALLLIHLRKEGVHALAMKPFCSGGRGDVHLLQSLQPGELPDAEMNPFYFPQPLAPAVAAEKNSDQIWLRDTVKRIEGVSRKCEALIIEGAGGALVPLGKNFMVADLIAALDCQVIITSRNRLGTLNHTLLTVAALKSKGVRPQNMAIAMMNVAKPDPSAVSNSKMLSSLLRPIKVVSIPYFGKNAMRSSTITSVYPSVRRYLGELIAPS